MKKIILIVAVLSLFIGCDSGKQKEKLYYLQLLHFADIDGNEERALSSLDELSGIAEAFKADPMYGSATLVVSSGDNIIPGSRFYAAEQSVIRAITGSNEPGHVDIAFLNYLGVAASALGNHDLDSGAGELADAISPESKDDASFPGSLFPYLSSNVDFSTDEDLAEKLGKNGSLASSMAGQLAGSAYAAAGADLIGLVGVTTPLLPVITTTGDLEVSPDAADWSMEELAVLVQANVDGLIKNGINKIVVLSHMQQIELEKELAGYLTGVDIIVAGGSNTRMGDDNDTLYPGDDAFDENYPFETKGADGDPLLIVNVDGDYKYLGRLVVGFNKAGIIQLDSLDEDINGSWASTQQNMAKLGGTPNADLVVLLDAVKGVIVTQYGNVLGYTSVYLDGRRSQVRTQETNLGNLSADANLWYANLMSDVSVDISLKNGGGIRTEIGAAIVPPGSVDYSEAVLMPPAASEEAGTAEGAVSEGHLRAVLRFDNGLVTLSVTASELKMLLEHAVAGTADGATPGQFPQVSGVEFAFDVNAEPGSRITSMIVTGEDGMKNDVVVKDAKIIGSSSRVFRIVTLNFLANGGDSYPFDKLSNPDRRNMYEGTAYGESEDFPDEDLNADPGNNTSFSGTGGEQDAFAEYLMEMYGDVANAYSMEETDKEDDTRIMY